ncbi:pyrroloquinoline quinone-dependent dehydrogenase [Parahaliea maris]|uniref:pyrroloquinoline quinone-dependent dehydrogenase n=1 Tax=Parahaliea maris TaxID=2716870 RepID=UPI001BB3DC81|nr:pyrroloquinoline quinone-dependent dehydrogenase [Parahaliea maris]
MRSASAILCGTLVGTLSLGALAAAADDARYRHWSHYGGDPGNTHFSALSQINRDNVTQLVPAWRYDSAGGKALPASSELQFNPIVVDGVLYGRNPLYNVFALDAASGEVIWTYNPPLTHAGMSNMRGVTYWPGEGERAPRLLFTTGHFLFALDAASGKLLEDFGDAGKVDLREGLGRDPELVSINAPSPGALFGNLIIMGSAVTETAGAAPGDVRAYDVVSGKLTWTFHTIPHPGEVGYDTWPKDAWKTMGGANAWAGMSLDQERGVVYVPTGSPAPDFDGSERAGANLFGNSIIALDAHTGKRLWHYQAVHHDLWDRDLSSAPTLVDVTRDGRREQWLAQASKQGVLYLLDRDSGEPVFPIEEVAVPPSAVPGEQAFPSQPMVTLPEPFTRQTMSPEDLSDINPAAHAHAKKLWDEAESFAYLRPPGLEPSVLFPGFYGGANWGGGAFDPHTNTYYINAMEVPNLVQMEAVEVQRGSQLGMGQFLFRQHCSGCHGINLEGFYPYAPALTDVAERLQPRDAQRIITEGKGRMMPFGHLNRHDRDAMVEYIFAHSRGEVVPEDDSAEKETRYVFAGYRDFVDERYYPAVKPPWGTLTAIDLTTGKRRWQIPLGEYEDLTKEGIPATGTRNYGGPVVTAGGLLIIAASSDAKLRIFDKESGELLWQYTLPAAGYATPATYTVNGRQFLVIACTGGKLGTPTGDTYLAFALPE